MTSPDNSPAELFSDISHAEQYGFTTIEEQAAYYRGAYQGLSVASLAVATETGKAIVAEHYAATHDTLTGLLNLAGLNEAFEQLGPDLSDLGVLYLDATNFKAVNDKLGYDRGDAMLREVALILRGTDIAARIGGDEFLVLLKPNPPGEKGPHRQQESSILEPAYRVVAARARIKTDIQDMLAHNSDVAAVGFDIAVGVTLGNVGQSPAQLKSIAAADMKINKAAQHLRNGRYDRNNETSESA